ncbi:MAG: hypothetical protein L6461_17820 [Anaerolineae bacterium]|nr:hypothetical protein [Anaerolineae bacterium]
MQCGNKQFLDNGKVDLLRFGVADAAFAHTEAGQQGQVGGQGILFQDVERNIVFLAGKANFSKSQIAVIGE